MIGENPAISFPAVPMWLQKGTRRYFNLVGSFFLYLDNHQQNYKSCHFPGFKHGRLGNSTVERTPFSPVTPVQSRRSIAVGHPVQGTSHFPERMPSTSIPQPPPPLPPASSFIYFKIIASPESKLWQLSLPLT